VSCLSSLPSFVSLFLSFTFPSISSSFLSYVLCFRLSLRFFLSFLPSSPNIIHPGPECNVLLCSECMSDKETPVCSTQAAGKDHTCSCLQNECKEC
jgi:hypothetical protein